MFLSSLCFKQLFKNVQETLHNHKCNNEPTDNVEALENGSKGIDKEQLVQKNENLFMNWPLMSSIIVYCIFSLHDIAYQEVTFLINGFFFFFWVYQCIYIQANKI